MRASFQILVFFIYLAALGWGGWYAFSGQMVADQEASAPEAIESDIEVSPPAQP